MALARRKRAAVCGCAAHVRHQLALLSELMASSEKAPAFTPAAHRKYIKRVSEDSMSYEYAVSEHLRMSGMCVYSTLRPHTVL